MPLALVSSLMKFWTRVHMLSQVGLYESVGFKLLGPSEVTYHATAKDPWLEMALQWPLHGQQS